MSKGRNRGAKVTSVFVKSGPRRLQKSDVGFGNFRPLDMIIRLISTAIIAAFLVEHIAVADGGAISSHGRLVYVEGGNEIVIDSADLVSLNNRLTTVEANQTTTNNRLTTVESNLGSYETTLRSTGDAYLADLLSKKNEYSTLLETSYNTYNAALASQTDKSYVGMIVYSNTMDTEAKVIEYYGGTHWEKIQDRMIVGAGSTFAAGSTGGASTHTLTVNEMPSHNHNATSTSTTTISTSSTSGKQVVTDVATAYYGGAYASEGYAAVCRYGSWETTYVPSNYDGAQEPLIYKMETISANVGSATTTTSTSIANAGSGTQFNIMNPYKVVYIWQRIS